MIRLLLICAALAELARAERYSFRVYGQREGLLNPVIRGVTQDETGYLWVSTEHGVYRFDGQRLEYMHPQGLEELEVHSMLATPDGAMWFRSGGRLRRYGGAGEFKIVAREPIDERRPQSMAADASSLWLISGAGTLARLPLKTLARETVHTEPGGLWSLLRRRDGTLMAGCGESVCEWTGTAWTKLKTPAGRYVRLHEGRDGTLYARSAERVLRRGPGEPQFTDISAGLPRASADQPGLALVTDFHRRVLVNTEAGLARYEGGAWRTISDAQGLVQQVVRDVFVDREGGIWLGSLNGLWRWLGDGAWRLFGPAEGVPRRGAEFAAQAKDGSLWLTSGLAGVSRGQRVGLEWRFQKVESLPPAWALITVWRDGGVWVGRQAGGILRYDPATGRAAPVEGSDPQAFVHDFSIDDEGRVLAITSRGLFREKSPNVLERLTQNQELYSLGFAPDRSLWVAGKDVILRVLGSQIETLHTTDQLEKHGIRALQPDIDGRIWMGTWMLDGLRAYRRQGDRLEPVPMEVGTPERISTFFLRRDRQQRLWAGTVRGIAALENGRWHTYGRAQGLLGDQCTNACLLRDGTIWFATSGGLAQYTPPVDRGPAAAPLTVIGRMTNRVDEELPLTGRPEVLPSANDITVDFAVLSTSLDAEPEVRYRLNTGVWRKARQRSLEFLKMAAGDYRLEVAARGSDGSWHAQPAAVNFRILPFWWQRGWFRGLVALVAAGLVAGLWWWLTQRRMRREQSLHLMRLREMFDGYPGVVFMLSPEGRFVMANRQLEEYARVAHGGLVGKLPREALSREVADNLARRLRQALEAPGPLAYRETYPVGGQEAVFDIRAFPLRDAEGRVESVCSFATDVTERVRLERERDEANLRYHAFIEQSSEAIIRVELVPPVPVDLPVREFGDLFYERALVAEANEAAAAQAGLPLEQLVGRPMRELRDRRHRLNREADRQWYQSRFQVTDFISVVRTPDGRERILKANATAIVENGCLVRCWSTQRDITEERRLQELISGMARGVSAETGARFFDRLAEHLAKSLGARQAFVREGETTLACWSGGRPEPGLRFDPSACAPGTFIVEPMVGANGETHGDLAVVFDEPREAGREMHEALDVFATRAEAELERLRAEREILAYQGRLRALGARNQRLAEEQRAHLAREIHDELGQQLTAIKIGLSFLRGMVKDHPRASEDVTELTQLADETVRSVRRLATELRPPALDQLGLAAAIRAHAKEASGRFGLEIDCQLDEVRPDGDTATAAFRIFQESLTNVARHAQASSATVRLWSQGGDLKLLVRDDGRGMKPGAGEGSLGLLGMRERAAAVGGTLSIDSAPDAGTTVVATLPLVAGHAAGA